MRTLAAGTSALLLIDLQARLMPAIEGGGAIVARAGRLLAAARLLGVPALATEHNAQGLGPMVPELKSGDLPVFSKMTLAGSNSIVPMAAVLPTLKTCTRPLRMRD